MSEVNEKKLENKGWLEVGREVMGNEYTINVDSVLAAINIIASEPDIKPLDSSLLRNMLLKGYLNKLQYQCSSDVVIDLLINLIINIKNNGVNIVDSIVDAIDKDPNISNDSVFAIILSRSLGNSNTGEDHEQK